MQIDINKYIEEWIKGINPEIRFWSNWLKTKGGRWPDDYAYRTQIAPSFALHKELEGKISISWPPKVLDVGSGPISRLGIATEQGNVDLHACDPLAPFYQQLFKEHNITPYIVPEFAYSEALTDKYEPCSFDIVHMSNALDHSFMPLAGIMSMLQVVKVEGIVYLVHAENEAENENYSGFHQWNITGNDNTLNIWRKEIHIDVSKKIEKFAEVDVKRISGKGQNKDSIIAILTKKTEVPFQSNVFKNTFDSELLKKLVTLY